MAAATAMLTAADTNEVGEDKSVSCVPNAVVLYNPYFRCAAPLFPPNFVTEGLPPMITFLGDEDPAIPVESIEAFTEALRKNRNAAEFYVGVGGKHGLCNGRNPNNPYFYWSVELTDRFLVKHKMLEGPATVRRPQGVKVLKGPTDFVTY